MCNLNIEKCVYLFQIAKSCQTITLACFNIVKQPMKFLRTENNIRQFHLTVTNQRNVGDDVHFEVNKILDRKCQFHLLTISLEIFETPELLNCYLQGSNKFLAIAFNFTFLMKWLSINIHNIGREDNCKLTCSLLYSLLLWLSGDNQHD